MELKLEHVLLFLLFVLLFRHVKCNRLTEGLWDFLGPDNGTTCDPNNSICGWGQDCNPIFDDDSGAVIRYECLP